MNMKVQRTARSHVCQGRRDMLLAASLAGVAMAFPQLAAAGKLLGVASEVYINGKRAYRGATIRPGDVVKTGGLSEAVFVVGKDAFMLRQRSEMRLLKSAASKRDLAGGLRVVSGGLLSVFAPGERTLRTPTMTATITGTGTYIEVNADSTYFCTCYGQANLVDSAGVTQLQVSASHHEAHLVHSEARGVNVFEPATTRNHYDEELRLLESLVGRRPPFMPPE